MSVAITNGVRVTVSTVYVPSQSAPAGHRYVFAYTIRIANEGGIQAMSEGTAYHETHYTKGARQGG